MRFLIFLFLAVRVFGITNASYAGGVAVAPLGEYGDIAPAAFFGDRRARTERLPSGEWAAIVGVSIDASAGEIKYVWYRTIDGKSGIVSFVVGKKSYPIQRLTIDKRMEALDEETIARVALERSVVASAIAEYSEDFKGDVKMRLPLAAPISSRFGLRRVINGTPRRPHGGTDLAAPKGTSVAAPSNGVVAIAANHFYCGNSVLLNHGEGLFTLYCHLDQSSVAVGQEVKTGETIGYVGATGRVTGAHLHWSAALNGEWFDPLLLVSNADLAKLTPPSQGSKKR
jgi:murein DD-endopeptidase MepM/ murein hydrolase activator NlpD